MAAPSNTGTLNRNLLESTVVVMLVAAGTRKVVGPDVYVTLKETVVLVPIPGRRLYEIPQNLS
jgi:hypothetical protein